MAKFEVTTEMIIHSHVTLIVEADDRASALDKVAEQLPINSDRNSQKGWKATVDLRTPKGIEITSVKPYYFEQASGGEKVKKVSA